jgi:hypothetical protein
MMKKDLVIEHFQRGNAVENLGSRAAWSVMRMSDLGRLGNFAATWLREEWSAAEFALARGCD